MTRLTDLEDGVLRSLVAELRVMFDVGRCTLRLPLGGSFPVVHEALAPGAGSIVGDTEVDLSGQPVVKVITEEHRQVVQDDCRRAYDDPAFQRMLEVYGGMGAQIVTPVLAGDELAGIVSLHHLGGPRRWTREEIDLAAGAARLVARILARGEGPA
jgi:GAF domain-containing protein